jgi:large subunit ribosomal protein L32
MAHPKRKLSHARGAKRRTHYKAKMPEIRLSGQVGGEHFKLMHHASLDGYYKGRRLSGFKEE